MPIESGATLIEHANETKFQLFLRNRDEGLILPVVSHAFRTAISAKGSTEYRKKDCSPNNKQALFQISKDNEPHGFVWHTTGAKLTQAVRWGVVKPVSLTGKVIATLGHYRISVHERVCKGMATATQSYKLSLLEHFQDRLSALSSLESLVNQDNTIESFTAAFEAYKTQLRQLTPPTSVDNLLVSCSRHCKNDIESAIKRIDDYLKEIQQLSPINPANRARGEHAILEFVKKEALQALYELQGLNQGITYSKKRPFALTRGELDEDIVDALKVIDDHRADPRNLVIAPHHYKYTDTQELCYHLDPAHFNPSQERQALMAISFIEGWDKVEYDALISPFNKDPRIYICNSKGETETLSVYRATKWRLHKNFTAFRKSVGHFLWNALKNFFISVQPWKGEAWVNPDFHLTTHDLFVLSRPTKPLIKKLYHFIKEFYYAFVDLFKGIRDFAYNLVIELPAILVNDWESTHFKADMKKLYSEANQRLTELTQAEQKAKEALLAKWSDTLPSKKLPPSPILDPSRCPVELPYALNPGELNDLLNSMVRGLDGFMSVFTHNIYTKDPIAGVLFTLAYMSGGGCFVNT